MPRHVVRGGPKHAWVSDWMWRHHFSDSGSGLDASLIMKAH